MVEDEGGQRERLLLQPEAELLAEGVLQTEAGDQCPCSTPSASNGSVKDDDSVTHRFR